MNTTTPFPSELKDDFDKFLSDEFYSYHLKQLLVRKYSLLYKDDVKSMLIEIPSMKHNLLPIFIMQLFTEFQTWYKLQSAQGWDRITLDYKTRSKFRKFLRQLAEAANEGNQKFFEKVPDILSKIVILE